MKKLFLATAIGVVGLMSASTGVTSISIQTNETAQLSKILEEPK